MMPPDQEGEIYRQDEKGMILFIKLKIKHNEQSFQWPLLDQEKQ